MNKISAFIIILLASLLLTQQALIYANDTRDLTSSEVKCDQVDKTHNLVTVKAGEEITSYQGRGKNNISIIEGGKVAHMSLCDSATASVKGGSASHIRMYDSSAISVSDNAKIGHLSLNDNSQGKISGGTFAFINLGGKSETHVGSLTMEDGSLQVSGVNVSGGVITLKKGATLHLYGQNISFSDGKLSGAWADGSRFKFWLVQLLGEGEEKKFEFFYSMPNQVIFHNTNKSFSN